MAEIFMQQLEHSHIKYLLDSKDIMFYARYIDDIIIIYNSSCTSPIVILQYANTIRSNLKLNPTQETEGRISFLDLTIMRKTTNLEIDIFRKPKTTNITINYFSNYPP
jgi:hypothetical protein